MTDETVNHKKRKKILLWVSGGFLFVGTVVFLYWLLVLRFEQYTDDAYVNGNMIEITPQVAGIVAAIYVDETDFVQEGQPLVMLDTTDYELAFEKSQHELGETVRSVVQMFIRVEELEAELERRDAELFRAKKDYENRVPLVGIGGVSKEEFEHVEAALASAEASRKQTFRSLQSAYAEVENTTVPTHPLVLKAIDGVKSAYVDLQRCHILAPSDGYVAQRKVQLGEWVTLSEPLMAVIPLNELWVDANFKEIQLSKVRVGQRVKMTADLYGGGVVFDAKVVGINPGTGNVFSALPPQNATGNWIKIVQRVPVRVSLDSEQLKKHPLWLGLSMCVTVDIKDTSGEMLAPIKPLKTLYQTAIYQKQEQGVEPIIKRIIRKNNAR